MKSNFETHLKGQYEVFQEIFQEYDFHIMAARDEAILYVIDEIAEYLITTYNFLKGQANLEISIDKDICPLDLTISAEQVFNFSTLLNFASKSSIKSYKTIRVCSNENNKKNFEYNVIFNNYLSLIIIENDYDELIVDLDNYYVINNTFNDEETDALLFTLTFVVLGFNSKQKQKAEKCKVIYLSDYKN